jgi:hypothetical protein
MDRASRSSDNSRLHSTRNDTFTLDELESSLSERTYNGLQLSTFSSQLITHSFNLSNFIHSFIMQYLILSLVFTALTCAQQGAINQIADGQIQAPNAIPTQYTPPATQPIEAALVPEGTGPIASESVGAEAIPNNGSGSYSESYSGSGTSVSFGSGSGSGSYGSGSSSGSGSAGSYGAGSGDYEAEAVAGYGITPASTCVDIYVNPIIAPTYGANGVPIPTTLPSGSAVGGDVDYTTVGDINTGEPAIITEDGEIVTLPAVFEGGANRGIESGWRLVGLIAMAMAVAVGMM